jgi:hypothetical protein
MKGNDEKEKNKRKDILGHANVFACVQIYEFQRFLGLQCWRRFYNLK